MDAVIERFEEVEEKELTKVAPFKLGYMPALDGLRAISILVVMFHHGDLFWMGRGGFLGVDIFFVLSGFLITTLLLQEWEKTGHISFKKFYSRRALRLLPALFALIIVALIGIWISPPPEGVRAGLKSILVVLFYSSNWIPALYPLGHTWSLSIEEQFYIAWPSMIFVMLKLGWKRRTIMVVITGIIGLIAAHRWEMFYSRFSGGPPLFHFRIYAGTDTRGDALLIGCLVGMLFSWNVLPRGRLFEKLIPTLAVMSVGFLALMIFAAPIWSKYLYYGLYTVVALAVAAILIWLNWFPKSSFRKFLEIPLLVWIGRLSYSLYLWHVFAYHTCAALMPPLHLGSYTLNIMIPLGIEMLGAFVLASISYYLIEKPFLNIKKRIRVVQD